MSSYWDSIVIETASLLRPDTTFHYLTGLPSFPDPQTLRRFLLNAPADLRKELHRINDRLLHRFIHVPERRSRLIFDLDSTVITSFGKCYAKHLPKWTKPLAR